MRLLAGSFGGGRSKGRPGQRQSGGGDPPEVWEEREFSSRCHPVTLKRGRRASTADRKP